MLNFIAAGFSSPDYWSDVGNGAISAIIGLALVLVVLIIMIGVLYLFRFVFIQIEKLETKKKAAKNPEAQTEAAITAAISEYRGDDQVKITVKSIKKL